ncbi:odorant receptor 4 [Cryptotermes secundus]|uniref:odorant receptor 4 n=1 Tax=Cryptotermes secundus TaxID=105785 RepID=UPI000CD7CBC1|nr:odorant receptor 4 [Cryptotermes secundus]
MADGGVSNECGTVKFSYNCEEVPVASTTFLTILLFIICVLSLLLLPCWYGNELTLQSLELAQAAYDCDWLDAPQSFKRSLVTIMCRAQKPVRLTAWKFFNVDLQTFTSVLRATYSFYQVLHKVYSE